MSKRESLRITRRTALKWGVLAAAAPALGAVPLDVFASGDSVVLLWNDAALQGARDSKLGPPMIARALAIVHTSVFDAWAAYDDRAIGTRFGGDLRRPHWERTLANINTAVSFAAYRAAVDLFPGGRVSVFDPLMRRLGYDPANTTTDPAMQRWPAAPNAEPPRRSSSTGTATARTSWAMSPVEIPVSPTPITRATRRSTIPWIYDRAAASTERRSTTRIGGSRCATLTRAERL